MKRKPFILSALIFAVLIMAIGCEEGTPKLIYTLPDWIHGEHCTATQDATREEAAIGEKYFVGVRASSSSLTFIYREKGEGDDASTDELVEYPYESIPSKINSSWTPGLPDNMYPDLIRIAAYPDGSPYYTATMRIEHSKTLEGNDLIEFSFNPEGIGGFRILK